MNLAENLDATTSIKLILMGFSGKGKSTAVIPLAIPNLVPGFPGYKLRILDFDGKSQEVALAQLNTRLNKAKAQRARLTPITQDQFDAAVANIEIEVLRETTYMTPQSQRDIVGKPRMWERACHTLATWEKDQSLSHIVVLDSWTHMCQAPLLAWCMSMQGKRLFQFGDTPHGRDYMLPQQKAKEMMSYLADIKSHTIITAHQSPTDMRMKTGDRDDKGNAVEDVVHSEMSMISIGSAGRVQLPSEFNHTLVAITDKSGMRKISTQIEDGVTTKTPFFAVADKSYPLNDGLAQYWMLAN